MMHFLNEHKDNQNSLNTCCDDNSNSSSSGLKKKKIM